MLSCCTSNNMATLINQKVPSPQQCHKPNNFTWNTEIVFFSEVWYIIPNDLVLECLEGWIKGINFSRDGLRYVVLSTAKVLVLDNFKNKMAKTAFAE